MKKIIALFLSAAVTLAFTGCHMGAVIAANDFSQLEMERISFDISQYPELISVLEDEDATVTYGKFNFNTTDMGITAKNEKGVVVGFYAVDIENKTITAIEPTPYEPQHGMAGSFVYNGKLYMVTTDADLSNNTCCAYLESEDGIVTLTQNGMQEFTTQFFCENGYIVMRNTGDEEGKMHYRVYSVDKGEFIIDKDIPYTDIREETAYDLLNWLDGERYMHFSTVTGEIIDVTEQFHAVDDNHIHGETPLDKMLDYRYVWNKTFYEIHKEYGVYVYTMNSAAPYITHIDKESYTIYQKPRLGDDGKTLLLAVFTMKERDR